MTQEALVSNKIADYYETGEHRAYDLLTQGHIHLGYWDAENRNDTFAGGANRLTQLMIDRTDVGEKQRFCDIGCGLGGPAIMLARQKGCLVDGVTISAGQQKEAAQRAARLPDIRGKARFWVADAVNLPFADNSYDSAWFFESIFHMGHHAALGEARRVLKPGAGLLITDVIDIGRMSAEEMAYAKDLCNVDYVSLDQYPALLENTGFTLVALEDISDKVITPLASKFSEALEEKKETVFEMLGRDEERLAAFETVGEKFEQIGYVMVQARLV